MYTLAGQTPVPEPDLLKWAYWMETSDRVVDRTRLGASLISTVFLGLDHGRIGYGGPPLLFETMIFTDGEAEDFQERCSTWLQAEQQHARAVEGWKTRQAGKPC
jgi:hypothetical protein